MLALANPASISLGLNICLDGKTHIPEQQPDRFWILLFYIFSVNSHADLKTMR